MTPEERRAQELHNWGLAAVAASLTNDVETYPLYDDYIARLDAEQRETLREALDRILITIDGMGDS